MKPTQQPEVPVTDLGLSAYLLSAGYSLIRTEGPPTKRTFIFSAVPSEVLYGYYSETAKVNPRTFLASLRDLKGLVAQGVWT